MNHLTEWILAPIFGMPCGVYNAHHCVMHHGVNLLFLPCLLILLSLMGDVFADSLLRHVLCCQEDNGELDLSSTELFQRDNFLHFLMYWARFFFLAAVELPLYCTKRGRWALAGKVLAGEVSRLLTNFRICVDLGVIWADQQGSCVD